MRRRWILASVAIAGCSSTNAVPFTAKANATGGGPNAVTASGGGASSVCDTRELDGMGNQDFTLTVSGSRSITCGGGSDQPLGIDSGTLASLSQASRVTHVDARSFTVESCASCEVGCTPVDARIQVDSATLPDLTSVLPVGAFVQVTAPIDNFYGCHFTLLVQNVRSQCGQPNPVASDDRTYLAVAFGSPGDDAWPFTVRPLPIGCFSDAGPNCGGTDFGVDSFDLEVGVTGAPETARVSMGKTASFSGVEGDSYQVHDIRSFQTAACDDYWNWSLWIARKP